VESGIASATEENSANLSVMFAITGSLRRSHQFLHFVPQSVAPNPKHPGRFH
jgi:hypothetical protein